MGGNKAQFENSTDAGRSCQRATDKSLSVSGEYRRRVVQVEHWRRLRVLRKQQDLRHSSLRRGLGRRGHEHSPHFRTLRTSRKVQMEELLGCSDLRMAQATE